MLSVALKTQQAILEGGREAGAACVVVYRSRVKDLLKEFILRSKAKQPHKAPKPRNPRISKHQELSLVIFHPLPLTLTSAV